MFRKHTSITLFAAAGLLVLAIPVRGDEPDWAKQMFSPTVVVKGKSYLVHYVPPASPFAQFALDGRPVGGSDVALLHTTLPAGDMKILFRTRGDRITLAGFIADSERLYVATHREAPLFAPGSGLPFAPEVKFHLYAFWLEDGSTLAQKELKEADVPKETRKGKRVEAGGPIELTKGGAKGFGVTMLFDGKKPVAPAPAK
jgi:hypothetical protein